MGQANLVTPEIVSEYLQRQMDIQKWAEEERNKLEKVILDKYRLLYEDCFPDIGTSDLHLALMQMIEAPIFSTQLHSDEGDDPVDGESPRKRFRDVGVGFWPE